MSNEANKRITDSAYFVGQRLSKLRSENGWTLKAVADLTGISVGTLSKLENGKTQLNFSSVNKLASGLGLRVTDLTNPAQTVSGQRTFTPAMSGVVFRTEDIDYEVLCSEISNSQQGYLRGVVKARKFNPNLPWHKHQGQEFIHVLRGTLELHTEHYAPLILKTGDSTLFDSSMGHHYVSKGRTNAEILITMSLEGSENITDKLS